jgi:Bacterial regulatory proteins, luxR family
VPESLWRWVKQHEVLPIAREDVPLRQSQLTLEREGKRLMIRLVSDLDQNLLMLEEHPTTTQLQSLMPFGLSPREAQVLDWVAQGKTNKEIGVILDQPAHRAEALGAHLSEDIRREPNGCSGQSLRDRIDSR